MNTRPIVILGGMGPQASIHLQQRLLQKSRQYHDGQGDNYPYIIHFSLPIPDFISDESKKHLGISLFQSLSSTISQLNPGCIALACNTAHLLKEHVPYLQKDTFVSLIETVASHIASTQTRKVGLLASPTTIRTKLYEDILAAQNITVLLPDSAEQAVIESSIRNVIGMDSSAADTLQLQTIASSLAKRGAQAILLGCTELPLIFDASSAQVPIFDCLDLYADAIVERWNRQRFASEDILVV